MELATKEYIGARYISGPLIVVEKARELPYASLVEIELPDGSKRRFLKEHWALTRRT